MYLRIDNMYQVYFDSAEVVRQHFQAVPKI
jgi:hypothetical protein